MALRKQPYLPLYVDDFLSDEKLVFCSAAATGVYIRLMCLMHKSEEYGKILLKQKFKQTLKQNESNLKNFASQLAVQMPYDYQTILFALEELVCTKVLQEEPCAISQRRMVKDNEISEKRALSGKKGGEKSLGKNKDSPPEIPEKDEKFAQANSQAITGIEIENENGIEVENGKEGEGGKTAFKPPAVDDVRAYCAERKNRVDAENFCNFYAAKGWMIGKNKMKDWRAAVRTWEKTEELKKQNNGSGFRKNTSDFTPEGVRISTI
jgi:hypothetical protein